LDDRHVLAAMATFLAAELQIWIELIMSAGITTE
jgi:hypothetical protein